MICRQGFWGFSTLFVGIKMFKPPQKYLKNIILHSNKACGSRFAKQKMVLVYRHGSNKILFPYFFKRNKFDKGEIYVSFYKLA